MKKYEPVLDYIENEWDAYARGGQGGLRNLIMKVGQLRLPNPFISPNDRYFAGTQFYWDTYFTILGLIEAGRAMTAKGMIDNLVYLHRKFGLIPARNSWTSVGRTQPPYLTRMAFEVYEAGGADKAWLDMVMAVALDEYETVWTSGGRYDVRTGLSNYRPRFLRRLLTVYESGWDRSVRFAQSGKSVVPVDLNCQLYQYEADFLKLARMNRDRQAIRRWQTALGKRRESINKAFWDERSGFYYDRVGGKRSKLRTLAGFYPLWCGAATQAQAKKAVRMLEGFEHEGGLSNTEVLPKMGIGAPAKPASWGYDQWDYPNGWAPLQLIVIEGLYRYGFNQDAQRLAQKWLDMNLAVFGDTGRLWEKYDVVHVCVGRDGRYPTQPGFAWTNAVFLRLLKHIRQTGI